MRIKRLTYDVIPMYSSHVFRLVHVQEHPYPESKVHQRSTHEARAGSRRIARTSSLMRMTDTLRSPVEVSPINSVDGEH